MKKRPLTGKQRAFVDCIEDSSSKKTYNNGLESARAAGYKGNDNTLAAIASENLTKLNVKAAREAKIAKRQAKSEHNYIISVEMLRSDYRALASKAASGDIQAIQARTAIVRELDDISGLHKQRFIDESEQKRELDEREKLEAKRIAGIRLHQDIA